MMQCRQLLFSGHACDPFKRIDADGARGEVLAINSKGSMAFFCACHPHTSTTANWCRLRRPHRLEQQAWPPPLTTRRSASCPAMAPQAPARCRTGARLQRHVALGCHHFPSSAGPPLPPPATACVPQVACCGVPASGPAKGAARGVARAHCAPPGANPRLSGVPPHPRPNCSAS